MKKKCLYVDTCIGSGPGCLEDQTKNCELFAERQRLCPIMTEMLQSGQIKSICNNIVNCTMVELRSILPYGLPCTLQNICLPALIWPKVLQLLQQKGYKAVSIENLHKYPLLKEVLPIIRNEAARIILEELSSSKHVDDARYIDAYYEIYDLILNTNNAA